MNATRGDPDSQGPMPFPGLPPTGYRGYPVGTIAFYGPDDRNVTKIVAGVVMDDDSLRVMKKWFGVNLDRDERTMKQVKEFFDANPVASLVYSQGMMGCPHEEAVDFPLGGDCPFCPFWAGKQGRRGSKEGEDRSAKVVAGFLYYRKDQWDQWKADAADPDEWIGSWEEWRDKTREKVRFLRSKGLDIRWEKVDLEAFKSWCREHRKKNDARARTEFVANQIRKK